MGGYAGKTKTKVGTVRDYQSEALRNVMKQVPNIKDVLFLNEQYDGFKIPDKSIIYCDPPYQNTSNYRTGIFDHDRFWNWCSEMCNKGHKVFVSEYTAPPDWMCVWSKEVKSSLSANGKSGGSKKSLEKLFTR